MNDEYNVDDAPALFSVIIEEMQDDDDGYRENAKFQWWFEKECTEAERAIINRVLIKLTGWSYATLLKKAEETETTTGE